MSLLGSSEHRALESAEELVKEMVAVGENKEVKSLPYEGSQSISRRNSIAEATVGSGPAGGAVSGCDLVLINHCQQKIPGWLESAER